MTVLRFLKCYQAWRLNFHCSSIDQTALQASLNFVQVNNFWMRKCLELFYQAKTSTRSSIPNQQFVKLVILIWCFLRLMRFKWAAYEPVNGWYYDHYLPIRRVMHVGVHFFYCSGPTLVANIAINEVILRISKISVVILVFGSPLPPSSECTELHRNIKSHLPFDSKKLTRFS